MSMYCTVPIKTNQCTINRLTFNIHYFNIIVMGIIQSQNVLIISTKDHINLEYQTVGTLCFLFLFYLLIFSKVGPGITCFKIKHITESIMAIRQYRKNYIYHKFKKL